LSAGPLNPGSPKVGKPPASLGLDPFYGKYLDAGGFPVISSARVPDEALLKAREVILAMTAGLPEHILDTMRARGVRLGIMAARYEGTTDIPEHRFLRNDTTMNWDVRARGLGGTPRLPLTTASEENILCYQIDKYHAEDILIHEFAHTIHLVGIVLNDPGFNDRLQKMLDSARAKGLWKDTYAETNIEEYWAEGVQTWFNVNATVPEADGLHNHIGTRAQLKEYDTELYALLKGFFPENDDCISCHCRKAITEADYERAEAYLYPNIRRKVYHAEVQPNWLEDSSGFWHVTNTRQGKRFFLTSLDGQTTAEAFDHHALATALAERTGRPVPAVELPFDHIRFIGEGKIAFLLDGKTWHFDLQTQSLETPADGSQDTRKPGISPDGTMEAFIRDYNLFIRDLGTMEEQQLSKGGSYQMEYANTYGWYDLMEGEGGSRPENFFVSWSPDSRKLLTYLVDLRHAEKMYLLDFSIDSLFRPRLLSYYRGSPGDTTVVYQRPVIFDLDAGKEIFIDVSPIPHFIGVPFIWSDDSRSLHALYAHRGFKQADVIRVDARSGRVETKVSETSDTSVEYSSLIMRRIGKDRLLFSSQVSGWHHLYLYDWESGNLINAVTSGEYTVRSVLHVDEELERIYFMAGGREPGRNPYYTHLYSIGFDGGDIRLLTPEDAHHQVSLSPCRKYFLQNYSRVDLPTRSLVRWLESGEEAFRVSEADADDLLAFGWKPPIRFNVKGRDGETDIYGLVYRPHDFNPDAKYPVIDYTYTGPHTAITPKSFTEGLYNIHIPFTAFGFAVFVVDGMGTAHRSKAFRDVSYMNMGYSLDCHVKAIRELSSGFSWLDTTRVGIFGHSAGGYDAGRALLQYPDFFKVGVASAADHDHRMEKAWWPEMYMGYPVGDFYHEQSNVTNAGKLKGRLLIAHGAIDENVNPSATYKLAEFLTREGKDFDMLILPGLSHSFGRRDGDYFTKIRWNYFIRHLLGAEPVLHYQFRTIP
jgi:dipeptidyl-peptidase 4